MTATWDAERVEACAAGLSRVSRKRFRAQCSWRLRQGQTLASPRGALAAGHRSPPLPAFQGTGSIHPSHSPTHGPWPPVLPALRREAACWGAQWGAQWATILGSSLGGRRPDRARELASHARSPEGCRPTAHQEARRPRRASGLWAATDRAPRKPEARLLHGAGGEREGRGHSAGGQSLLGC